MAMMGIKLNAQVMIKNLRNMHEKSLPPTLRSVFEPASESAPRRMELRLELPPAVECQDWARLQGRGPHTGGRNDRLVAPGVADVVAGRLGTDKDPPSPVDST
jgi:hypothetical protein